MGYEIFFSYYESKDGGGYDTETSKTFKKVIGTQDADTPLEDAAGEIFFQRARRDVFIHDVAVAEFVRRPIAFKETKGGIVLKNRKFGLDQARNGAVGSVPADDTPVHAPAAPEPSPVEASLRQMLQEMQKQMSDMQARQAAPANPHSILAPAPAEVTSESPPIRYEMFVPEPSAIPMIKARNVPLTVDKKYPVLKEGMNGSGNMVMYTVRNDNGGLTSMPALFFSPPLVGVETTKQGVAQPGPCLVGGDDGHGLPPMTDIRRGR